MLSLYESLFLSRNSAVSAPFVDNLDIVYDKTSLPFLLNKDPAKSNFFSDDLVDNVGLDFLKMSDWAVFSKFLLESNDLRPSAYLGEETSITLDEVLNLSVICLRRSSLKLCKFPTTSSGLFDDAKVGFLFSAFLERTELLFSEYEIEGFD